MKRRRGAELRRAAPPPSAPNLPETFDLELVAAIRSNLPLWPGVFVKEPPSFLEKKPAVLSSVKIIPKFPYFYVLDPELLGYRTRSLASVVLCISPWVYVLIM